MGTPAPEHIIKIAATFGLPIEMLGDRVDIFERTFYPPSPLAIARMNVEDARAMLEDAEEALAAAEDKLVEVLATPGSDTEPPSFTFTEAMNRALDKIAVDLA